MDICREYPSFVKIGEKEYIGHPTGIPEYILLLTAKLNCRKSAAYK